MKIFLSLRRKNYEAKLEIIRYRWFSWGIGPIMLMFGNDLIRYLMWYYPFETKLMVSTILSVSLLLSFIISIKNFRITLRMLDVNRSDDVFN